MGSVVALDEFRQAFGQKKKKANRTRPVIRGSEIWGRDYTEMETVVFGLLMVRDIVAYHTGDTDMAFDQLCMDSLEAAYRIGDLGPARLKEAVKPVKEWLLDIMTDDNKRDISWAIVITDLIEKTPIRKGR